MITLLRQWRAGSSTVFRIATVETAGQLTAGSTNPVIPAANDSYIWQIAYEAA